MKIPIEKMLSDINKRVQSFKREWQPKYVKESSFVKDNEDIFSVDEYESLTTQEQQRYKKLIEHEYKNMPNKDDLQKEYKSFKDNFNKMLEDEQEDFRINDRNANDFKEFVEYTDSVIKSKKYRDSLQIVQKFKDYLKVKNEKSISEYYEDNM